MIEFVVINYEAHWQQHFGGHPAVEDFMDMDQDFCKHHEAKTDKGALKIIIREKKATQHFKEHCTRIDDIWLVAIRFFFFQINLVFRSNLVFIDILDSFYDSLFPVLPVDFYLYSTDLEVYPMHLRLFYKNQ